MGKKVGIVCASDAELEPILRYLKGSKTMEKAGLTFHEGTVGRTDAVALFSGVCKVNAAIAAQALIDSYDVAAVINAGVAGGIDETVRLFDTVISEQVAYHDVADDILTEFHPWLESVYFPADRELLARARAYCETVGRPVRFGKSVTGEAFIADEGRAEIIEKFAPLSVDMETGAFAHVCYVNQVPFLAVRTITDTAEHAGKEHFEENCAAASQIAADIVAGLLGAPETEVREWSNAK